VIDCAAAENLEGERKTVVALFADIKDSTELEPDLDPEEASALRRSLLNFIKGGLTYSPANH